ncbi:hypothetical protein PENTCL1PPCAC_2485 [Pristionchus entomophagus]|uniref:Suppressor of forked domain-containing protein n=1 Tax=Pristionchus entomophagus TaxID=358040 RepID=A0AAV5SJH3_9BILA|nr:hypothetical protein PENTCL1PPCAC_2485 [Pristionchus entomophagus]
MGRKRSISPTRSRSGSRSKSPRRRIKRERKSPDIKREIDNENHANSDLPKDIEIFESFAENNSSMKKILKRFDWNYEDANLWMEVIKELEKEEASLAVMRAAFSEIVDRWPYCYGYWCKWASLEAKWDSAKAIEVFEYAVNVFPLSVDLWLSYIRLMRMELMKRRDGLEGIQRLNARALMRVGKEWRSLPVWKEVIAFENSIGNSKAVTIVMDNMISTPLNGLNEAWELLTNHFEITPLNSLLKDIERNEIEGQCLKDEMKMDERICKMKALERRRGLYEETRRKAKEMGEYESRVKRHYFHWKPLERGQLVNWRRYLEWTRSHCEGANETVLIFERALIPCALYDEFWLMYADYRESRGELDLAMRILERAHRIHCKKSVNITINLASLMEIMDLGYDATEVLINFDMKYPGNLLIYNRYLSIIKRREMIYSGKESVHDKSVCETYECLIRYSVLPYAHLNPRMHSHELYDKDRHHISSYYSMHYARYLRKVKGQSKMALKVLKTAIANDPTNETLYHALIDLHYEKYPLDSQSIKESFDLCINSPQTPLRVKVRMSQCKIELFEEIGTCPKEIREFTTSHRELMSSKEEKEFID